MWHDSLMNSTTQKGTLSIATGLVSLLTSISMLSARKAHGETANAWLGSDDFVVMGTLFFGSIGLLGAGIELYLAGIKQDSNPNINEKNKKNPTHPINQHLSKAAYFGISAALVYFGLSIYAFLTAFGATPTPESHIGPHGAAQAASYGATYGSIGLMTIGWSVYSAYKAHCDCRPATARRVRHVHIADH